MLQVNPRTGQQEPLSASPSLFPRATVLSIGKLHLYFKGYSYWLNLFLNRSKKSKKLLTVCSLMVFKMCE
jgi:hypothetical protein